jgi:hypothetical protein
MKYTILIVLFLLAVGCAKGSVMSMTEFENVPVGSTVAKLETTLGKPYDILNVSREELEYEYIERITLQAQNIRERHYFFIVKNGVVIAKRIQDIAPPPLQQRNSYELQTSNNNEQK